VELGAVSERELTGLYQSSHILLFPSLQEGFGLCVLEALAAGLPAIVSAREPFTEYLTETSACFVDPECAVSIAAAVVELWTDPERRAALGRSGAARARKFSWDNVAQEHERLYRTVLGRRALSSTTVYEGSDHA
jgi:glycosyltransferase involved in cell wall biosynthesis